MHSGIRFSYNYRMLCWKRIFKEDYEKLKRENERLKEEIKELKFGAEKLYKDAESYYNNKEYEKAKKR